jgi:hypothetical protein
MKRHDEQPHTKAEDLRMFETGGKKDHVRFRGVHHSQLIAIHSFIPSFSLERLLTLIVLSKTHDIILELFAASISIDQCSRE